MHSITTDGTVICRHAALKGRPKVLLGKIQKLVCLGITRTTRRALTRTLKALLNLSPLHFVVEFEARRTVHMLNSSISHVFQGILLFGDGLKKLGTVSGYQSQHGRTGRMGQQNGSGTDTFDSYTSIFQVKVYVILACV